MQRTDNANLIPVGRPPFQWNPAWPALLIEHMAEGHSFVSFGAVIGYSREVLYKALKLHEEFNEAYKRGKVLCQAWWEAVARAQVIGAEEAKVPGKRGEPITIGSKWSPAMTIWQMRCRFPEDYRENAVAPQTIEELASELLEQEKEIEALETAGQKEQ